VTQHFILLRPWEEGNSLESYLNPIAIEMSKTRLVFKELDSLTHILKEKLIADNQINEIFTNL